MPFGPHAMAQVPMAVPNRAKARAVMMEGFCHGALPGRHPKTYPRTPTSGETMADTRSNYQKMLAGESFLTPDLDLTR